MIDVNKPVSREEIFYRAIAQANPLLLGGITPVSRREHFLNAILNAIIMGGGGGGGVAPIITASNVTVNPLPNPNIHGNNVQEILDSMSTELDLLNNSDVFIVDDLNDYNAQKDSFDLITGDLVYFLDSTGVVDHQGVPVDNDGKPIVMIYDENATANSNKLRVFSKLQDKLNLDNFAKLDADNVFTGTNRFDDLEIEHVKSTTHNKLDNATIVRFLIGDRTLTTGVGGYVKHLYLQLRDNVTSAFIDDISVFSISKGATRDQDIIEERIIYKQSFQILTDVNGDKYIEIPIDRKFDTDVYLGIHFTHSVGIRTAIQDNGDDTLFCENVTVDTITVGNTIPPLSRHTWRAVMSITLYRSVQEHVEESIIDSKNHRHKILDRYNNKWKSQFFRIPSLLRTAKGTLLSFADIRHKSPKDQTFIDIGMARSTDNGSTWSYATVIENNRVNQDYSRVMDATSLKATLPDGSEKILVLGGAWDTDTVNWENNNLAIPNNDWHPYLVESTDDGITWSSKISLRHDGNRPVDNVPQGTVSWLGGVGTGIQMSDGRLVFPIQIRYAPDINAPTSRITRSGVIISQDYGQTWRMSTGFVSGSENMVVEVDGNLIMNNRNGANRSSYISTDLGETWSIYSPLNNALPTIANGCQGSFIAYDTLMGHRVGLLSAPKNLKGGYVRDNISIYMIDLTNPSKGIRELLIPYPYDGNSNGGGYSSLSFGKTTEGKRVLEIVYEADGSIEYQDISYLLHEIETICTTQDGIVTLDGINEFTGSIEFKDVTPPITGKDTLENNSTHALDHNTWMGYRYHTIEADTYISTVKVAVAPNLPVGSHVTNFSVCAVESVTSWDTDIPYEILVDDETFTVMLGEDVFERYIEIPINRPIAKTGYLMFKANSPTNARPIRTTRKTVMDYAIVHTPDSDVVIDPVSGTINSNPPNRTFMMLYEVSGETLDVASTLLNLLDNAIKDIIIYSDNTYDIIKMNGHTETKTIGARR